MLTPKETAMAILKHLWDIIYDSPNLQGGFIWDFMDQGFKIKTEQETDVLIGRIMVRWVVINGWKIRKGN